MSAPRQYVDFPIEFRGRSSEGFEAAVLGETQGVAVAFAEDELDGELTKLDRGALPADDVLRLGQRLTTLLLPEGPIRELFDDALDAAERQHTGVRIRLSTWDGPLALLPWELCYLQRHRGEASPRHFLALDPLVSFVRYPPLDGVRPALQPVDPARIRLVACIADGSPYVPLDLEKERRAIEDAFLDFAVPGVEITQSILPDATFAQLTDALGPRADLFHFGGHGVFDPLQIDPATGRPIREGSIVLRADQGKSPLVGAASLALQLRGASVRVAVLGACDSGRQDGVSAWTGIAPALIEKGIAAVVAMQFRIADRMAIQFSATFYRELARGVSVDEAVAAARLDMFQLDPAGWQWAVPVLYTRSADTFVFPVGPVGPAPAAVVGSGPRLRASTQVRGTRPLAFLTGLFDRAPEQEALRAHLADPGVRVISVVGREGIGKSAIVSVVMAGLEQNQWHLPETRIHVDGIAYLSARDPTFTLDRLFSECAGLLADDEAERLNRVWANETLALSAKIERLLQALAAGYRVIVLDDVESLLGEGGEFPDLRVRTFVEAVLSAPAAVHLVLVSRIEPTYGSRSRSVTRVLEVNLGLPLADGIAMLQAQDSDGDLGIRTAAEADVRDAVARVGGVPRALELVAALLERQRLSSLPDVIKGFFKDEIVIRDLIENTYGTLDVNDRLVIEALSVFRGPVPMDAVRTLLAPVAGEFDLPAAIVRLARSRLVNADRTTQTVSIGAIDQEYSYAHLPQDGPMGRRESEVRAAEYFKSKRTPPEGWQQIDDLDPQIREFEHRLRADDPDGASDALATVDVHMAWHGSAELARWLRGRLDGLLTDPRQRALHAYAVGHIRIVMGPFAEAAARFDEARQAAQLVPDDRLAACALGWNAETNRRLGELELADRQCTEAIQRLEVLGGKPDDVALFRLVAGLIAAYRGDGRAAIEQGEYLLGQASGVSHAVGQAHDCLSLGYLVLGQLEEAARHAGQSVDAYTQAGEREPVPYIQGVQGMVYAAEGKLDEALERFERAEAGGAEAEQPRIRGLALFNRARVHRMLGQATKALTLARDAEAVLLGVGAFETRAAASLARALASAAGSDPSAELTELLHCARSSSRSADLQPPLDLAREVETRALELGLDPLAAEAAAFKDELAARLAT